MTKSRASATISTSSLDVAGCRIWAFPSDGHHGCRMGLCTAPVKLDDGGWYKPSPIQRKVAAWWHHCFYEWLPIVCKGEPFGIVYNGDALEGDHHRSKTPFSTNVNDQEQCAYNALAPLVDLCQGRYIHLRGTDAHSGQAGENEERLARRLGAIPGEGGQYAHWAVWKRIGTVLVHTTHHVSGTGSQAYEATAPHKDYLETCAAATKEGREAPQAIVRSHRHRHIVTSIGTHRGPAYSIITPGWQLKTGYVYRTGFKASEPELGLVVIKVSDTEGKRMTESGDSPIRVLQRTFYIDRPKEM